MGRLPLILRDWSRGHLLLNVYEQSSHDSRASLYGGDGMLRIIADGHQRCRTNHQTSSSYGHPAPTLSPPAPAPAPA